MKQPARAPSHSSDPHMKMASQVLESMLEGVSLSDEQGVMIYTNPAYDSLFGYKRGELIGKHVTVLNAYPIEENHRIVGEIIERLKTRGAWVGEFLNRKKDGSPFTTTARITRIELDGKKFWVSVQEEVTKHDILEDELRKRDNQLLMAQKMEAVGRLARGISHEFNNMLTGILGFAQLIKGELPKSSPGQADADGIVRLAKRAADLVSQLLNFSRSGKSARTDVQLNDLVKKRRNILAAACGERIELAVKLADDLPRVPADQDQISSVLMSLCLNACEAIKGPGRICIQTRAVRFDQPASLGQGSLPAGRYAVLAISDTGEGIPKENFPRIFEPFFSTKAQGRGTGMNLAIAYGVAKGHGGIIDFDSTLGRGTTFEIYLPAAEGSTPGNSKKGAAAKPGKTILVADDEAALRRTTARILERQGYAVLLAADGQEAVDLFRANQDSVSLVLLDVMMPKLDGLAAYEGITAMRPDAKIIFMSGYATADAEELVRRVRAPFLPKPFDIHELTRLIESCLAG